MLFIKRGAVKITIIKGVTEYEVARRFPGHHFGEQALLEPETPRSANVVTLTFCDFQVGSGLKPQGQGEG